MLHPCLCDSSEWFLLSDVRRCHQQIHRQQLVHSSSNKAVMFFGYLIFVHLIAQSLEQGSIRYRQVLDRTYFSDYNNGDYFIESKAKLGSLIFFTIVVCFVRYEILKCAFSSQPFPNEELILISPENSCSLLLIFFNPIPVLTFAGSKPFP